MSGEPESHVYLETERLMLRRFAAGDVDLLVELDADPDVMRFLTGGAPSPRERYVNEIIPRWLAYYETSRGFGFWAAIEKRTGDFIGWFHLRPLKDGPNDEAELGYRLRRASWGRGYATEASKALIDKGFTELRLRRVVAFTMAVNAASRRVMEKVGMRHVRTFHEPWPDPIPGAEHGEVEYEIRSEDWQRTA